MFPKSVPSAVHMIKSSLLAATFFGTQSEAVCLHELLNSSNNGINTLAQTVIVPEIDEEFLTKFAQLQAAVEAYTADSRSFDFSEKPTMLAQKDPKGCPPCKEFTTGQMEIVKQLTNMNKQQH